MIEMLSNIYDRLHFISEKIKVVEERTDKIEGFVRHKKLNTLYGERKRRFRGLLKRVKS